VRYEGRLNVKDQMKRQASLSNQMIKKINEQILFIQQYRFERIAALLKQKWNPGSFFQDGSVLVNKVATSRDFTF
jgi:hypothetical protein